MSLPYKVLVVGGTSGLGLELAKRFLSREARAVVAGRRNPGINGLHYFEWDVAPWKDWKRTADRILEEIGRLDALVCTAGFYQKGTMGQLKENYVSAMLDVCLHAPIFFLRRILETQGTLPLFLPVTSTSEWTPRLEEPVYNAAKAGLGLFARAVSLDPSVGKVLMVAPSGMKGGFWRNDPGRDQGKFLEPSWVADQVMAHVNFEGRWRYLRVLRDPPQVMVEVGENKFERLL